MEIHNQFALKISKKMLKAIMVRTSIPIIAKALPHGKSALWRLCNRSAKTHETPIVPTIATKNSRLTSPWMPLKMEYMKIYSL